MAAIAKLQVSCSTTLTTEISELKGGVRGKMAAIAKLQVSGGTALSMEISELEGGQCAARWPPWLSCRGVAAHHWALSIHQ